MCTLGRPPLPSTTSATPAISNWRYDCATSVFMFGLLIQQYSQRSGGCEFREEHDHRVGTAAIGATGNEWCGVPFLDLMRRAQSRVDPPAPRNLALVVHGRQLELKRLPVGIQDHVKQEVIVSGFRGECQAVRGVGPVRLAELYTMPRAL